MYDVIALHIQAIKVFQAYLIVTHFHLKSGVSKQTSEFFQRFSTFFATERRHTKMPR